MAVKFITEVVKSLFGLSKTDSSTEADEGDARVTVEREPADAGDVEPEKEPELEEAEPEEETIDAPVGEISGIGPTYSERLNSADIETVADLAQADAAAVADAAEVSESRASDWISKARDW